MCELKYIGRDILSLLPILLHPVTCKILTIKLV